MRDEIDRLWTSLVTAPPLHGWSARAGQGTFPAVNVRETDAALVVETLNGYRKKLPIPDNIAEFALPLGVPEVLRPGTDVTVVSASTVSVSPEIRWI